MPPIRQFGFFTAFGVLAAMVFSLTLFPALLSMLPAKVSRGLVRQMRRSGDLAATGWAARTLAVLGRGVARRPLLVWLPTLGIVWPVSGRQPLYSGRFLTHRHISSRQSGSHCGSDLAGHLPGHDARVCGD